LSKKKKIVITVCSLDEFKEMTREAFRRANLGLPPKEPRNVVSFETESSLFSALSPKRMELMRYLKGNGPMSCRRLATELERAYANVHDDVQQLLRLGLLERNRDKKLFVPWDEVEILLKLVA